MELFSLLDIILLILFVIKCLHCGDTYTDKDGGTQKLVERKFLSKSGEGKVMEGRKKKRRYGDTKGKREKEREKRGFFLDSKKVDFL